MTNPLAWRDPSRVLLTEPWQHQRQAFEFTYPRDESLLAMGVGTGKTLTTIWTILARGHEATLVVCPKKVVEVWPEQFERHSALPVNVVPLLKGTARDKSRWAVDNIVNSPDPTVLVVNFDSVWRQPLSDTLKKLLLDCVVVDESQKIKAAGSKVSQFMFRLGRTVGHRVALTGTPLHNTPLDAYGQCRYLDPSIFGTNFGRFRDEYAVMRPGPNPYAPIVTGYKNQDEFAEKLGRVMFQVSRDVLDLPSEIYTLRYGYLGAEARRIYRELDKEFITWLSDTEAAFAANALTKFTRLQQVANGFVKDENGLIHTLDDGKAELLRDTLSEIPGEPVPVFGWSYPDLDTIRRVSEEEGRPVYEVSGRVNELSKWQKQPQGDGSVLVVQSQAGGVGIDMTRAKYAVLFTGIGVPGDMEQLIGRLVRPGQEHHVTFISLVMRDTVDENTHKTLVEKTNAIDDVMRRARGG